MLTAWLLGAAAGASGQVKAHTSAKATVISVWSGKPTELGFTLSKASRIPAGTVTFKYTNVGLGFHDFKICTTPVKSNSANTCVGKATKVLKNGQTATLTVTLTKAGEYEFLCTVTGHAAAGMKGLIGVGVAVPKSAAVVGTVKVAASTTTTSAATTTTAATTTVAAGGGGGGGGGGVAQGDNCPAGVTIATSGGTDNDLDESGGPTDGDGCL